jgi:hypothetical protein
MTLCQHLRLRQEDAMTAYLHELACTSDPCSCAVLYPVAETERMSDNRTAEVAVKKNDLESRSTRPVRYLASGGSLREVTGGRP